MALTSLNYSRAGGPERRARLAALIGAAAFGTVLVVGAVTRLAGADDARDVLFAYDVVVCLLALGLFVDLLWGRWAQAAVTGVVVDLGEPDAAGTLRDRLARTLGRPDARRRILAARAGAIRRRDRPRDRAPGGGSAACRDADPRRRRAGGRPGSRLGAPRRPGADVGRRGGDTARGLERAPPGDCPRAGRRRRGVPTQDRGRGGRAAPPPRAGAPDRNDQRRLGRVAELAASIDPELERQVRPREPSWRAGARNPPGRAYQQGLGEALRELGERAGATVECGRRATRRPGRRGGCLLRLLRGARERRQARERARTRACEWR